MLLDYSQVWIVFDAQKKMGLHKWSVIMFSYQYLEFDHRWNSAVKIYMNWNLRHPCPIPSCTPTVPRRIRGSRYVEKLVCLLAGGQWLWSKVPGRKKEKRHAPDQELPWFIISLVSLALWEEPHFQTSKKIYEVSSRPSSIATLWFV